MKILMVCLGNICRSPLAEGILRQKVEKHQLDWQVESAGTGSWHIGEPPDPRSRAVARSHGLDISGQRARQVRPEDLQEFDYIFAMDSSNLQDLLQMQAKHGGPAQVEMILDRLEPGERRSVPDPYWDDDGFEQVFQMLDEATDALVDQLVSEKA